MRDFRIYVYGNPGGRSAAVEIAARKMIGTVDGFNPARFQC